MGEEKPQISGVGAFFLIATALFIDLLQVLLAFTIFFPWVLNIAALLIFGFWFNLIYGIPFAQLRMVFRILATLAFEMIPVVNGLLFTWTVFVALTIFLESRASSKNGTVGV